MSTRTLYQQATEDMQRIVGQLLGLSKTTSNFTSPPDSVWGDDDASRLLLGGLGADTNPLPPRAKRKDLWLSRSALPFSLEHSATTVLYRDLQPFIDSMIKAAYSETKNFSRISAEWIYANPHLLPVLMHAGGTFSKQELGKLVGSVSDTGISRPASERLADLLGKVAPKGIAKPEQVRERMRATTEGIVRDLVGRLLLEEFVASALDDANVDFKRESEYESLAGVVYDFRADFVVPSPDDPLAFLEVRKSSARHASLYAKDKMFSAINWKGKHPNCLGILVVDGPWTETSLEVMMRVFDYVVPIGRVADVAGLVRKYLDGDKTVLRWLIEFRISKAT